jgi:hypothetical protein
MSPISVYPFQRQSCHKPLTSSCDLNRSREDGAQNAQRSLAVASPPASGFVSVVRNAPIGGCVSACYPSTSFNVDASTRLLAVPLIVPWAVPCTLS